MNTTENQPVLFVTQNQKLYKKLCAALPHNPVLKTEDLQEVNRTVNRTVKSGQAVGAVVLHVKNVNSWMIFDLLKSGYPYIPRFALIGSHATDEDFETERMIAKYGAAGMVNEANGLQPLIPLINQVLKEKTPEETDSKGSWLTIYGDVQRELARLDKEFFTTGLRTLPQPQIGQDSHERLIETLEQLKEIKIRP